MIKNDLSIQMVQVKYFFSCKNILVPHATLEA